ncbi:hypothetical protein [Veronia pacifica]|uniref:Uncharacterized protein n=1 Tax=Veronia pacifica TaxID=1080227 RepID=A0A1C3EQS6_9GAMM|nr:hypothetical protein [Veronia pacifica]ODA35591.1 hypothetical protein A8L45_02910 [Veronia pacifica]
MNVNEFEIGMLVECQKGVGRVTKINTGDKTVVINQLDGDADFVVPCDEIQHQPQLHEGCETYY